MPSKLLIVDDDPPTCGPLAAMLATESHGAGWQTAPPEAIEQMSRDDFDVLLTDLHVRALRAGPAPHPIRVNGHAPHDAAVAAMCAGAYDFITKPVDPKALVFAIAQAVEHRKQIRDLQRPHVARARPQGASELVGSSRSIRAVHDLVCRVATTEAPVLLLGESGTGKELVARAIHEASPRAHGPFVALNCAAATPSLIESELFGHVKGAFTDARRARDGLFVEASGGTLFLDEIADLPLELQPKLLRALQEREVRPVGGSQEVRFDARIITATNADLDARVLAGQFRGDLMYRIDVVRIELPPLRERDHDVLVLAQHLLDRHATDSGTTLTLGEEAAAKLMAYDWPGNVRELENCMQRALAVAQGERIEVDDLPLKVREHRSERVSLSFEDAASLVTLEELDSRYIRKVLEMVGGNKSKAARLLGMDRRSLYRRIDKLGTT
jgi:DNA-binding NtrC family response regulator